MKTFLAAASILSLDLAALPLFFCFTSMWSMPCHAYLEDYTPISEADKKRKVGLSTVSDAGLKEGKSINIGTAEMRLPEDGNDIVFSGLDKNGKPWTLSKRYFGLGTVFFTTDLDCNGTTDIVLLQATGGCGISPPTLLTFLLFDKNLRPFPMEISSYSDSEDWTAKRKVGYIDDLITLGSDKHAVLVCNELDRAELKNKSGSFWRISMYRANNGRWERIRKYRENNMPMIVRYTSKRNLTVIPNPVPSLRTFQDGAFGSAEEKLCKTGSVSKVELDNGKVKTLTITPNLNIDVSGWSTFHPFIIQETPKKYELCGLNSEEADKQMKKFAEKKAHLRYSKPTSPQKPPLYLWTLEN